jgi:microfibrillar-associated protein 1
MTRKCLLLVVVVAVVCGLCSLVFPLFPNLCSDGLDEVLEYEAWKVREMRRIKRDLEEREALEHEKAEVERRRNMTDEERMREDEAAGRFKPKEKKKWKFMQKYYHKGVFYMDEGSVKSANDARAKSYDEATGEDRFNKEALPSVLQVRNFGKRGRTKWTHLAAEDTTRWDNPWFQKSDLREKYTSKMAGMKDISSSSKRPRKDS